MIVRVRIRSQAIKGKDAGIGGQVALCAPTPKKSQHTPLMSADPNTPLFMISDGDDVKYKDDPAISQAKVNLAAAEQIQQERAKQRGLEREEWKVQAEVERMRWEIEEVEREQRELEEAEVERLTQEKEKLEEENRAEQQCCVGRRGQWSGGEWHRCLRLAQVGHLLKSQRGLQRGSTRGRGLLSLRRIAHSALCGSCCVSGTWRGMHRAASCVDS